MTHLLLCFETVVREVPLPQLAAPVVHTASPGVCYTLRIQPRPRAQSGSHVQHDSI